MPALMVYSQLNCAVDLQRSFQRVVLSPFKIKTYSSRCWSWQNSQLIAIVIIERFQCVNEISVESLHFCTHTRRVWFVAHSSGSGAATLVSFSGEKSSE